MLPIRTGDIPVTVTTVVGLGRYLFGTHDEIVQVGVILLAGAILHVSETGSIAFDHLGLAGAGGAFGVLLAFGSGGSPASVMTIVFAGAPVINALVALMIHPPQGG